MNQKGYELLNKLWCCICGRMKLVLIAHLSTANNLAEILMVIRSLSTQFIINKSKFVIQKVFHSKIYSRRKCKMLIENKLRALWYSMYSLETPTLHRTMECYAASYHGIVPSYHGML